MSDFVVCPVCHSRNEADARACVTCGAPLADARLPEGGAEHAGLWATGEADAAAGADDGADDADDWGVPEAIDGAGVALPAEPEPDATEDAAAGEPEAEPAAAEAEAVTADEEPVETTPWAPLQQPAEPWPADAWPPGPGQVAADADAADHVDEPAAAAVVAGAGVAAAAGAAAHDADADADAEEAFPGLSAAQAHAAGLADAADTAAAEPAGATPAGPATPTTPATPEGAAADAAATAPGEPTAWLPVSAAAQPAKPPKPGECWNCGQKNPRSREFCKRCGQRLHSDLSPDAVAAGTVLPPVKGGRGKRAVAFIWTILVLAAVVVVGVVAFGGFLPKSGASPTPVPTPLASAPVVVASPAAATPVASSGAHASAALPTPTPTATPAPTPTPTRAPTPTPTATPAPTPTPSATPEPTSSPEPTKRPDVPSPGAITTTASPRAPAPIAFDCRGPVSLRDPLDRTWVASGIFYADRPGYDRITIRLTPVPETAGADTRVNVSIRKPTELLDMGLPQPAEGEVVVLVRFADDITLLRQMQVLTEKTAVRTLTATNDADGKAAIVLGVTGKGCVALQAPAWDDPSAQHTPFVDLTLDVQH
ncbi:MAG: hypothetical protein U0869_10435 [Chloroflexota bacterium]